MPHLMPQHRRQLGLGVEIGEQAAMDIDVAARQGEGIEVRRIDHGEVIGEIAAMTVTGNPKPNLLDVGLEFFVGVARIFLGDFLVVAAAQVELLLLAHRHEVGAPRGRIDRATGQQGVSQQQRQTERGPFH
ncbi:hypothetical protein D9M71_496300 [compost metagenome]